MARFIAHAALGQLASIPLAVLVYFLVGRGEESAAALEAAALIWLVGTGWSWWVGLGPGDARNDR